MKYLLGTLTSVAVIVVGPLGAQQGLPSQPVDSGTLVRVHVDGALTLRGRLVTTYYPNDAALHYCRYPGPCSLPADSLAFRTMLTTRIRKLEVQSGTMAPRYGLIALAIGTVAGYAIGRQVKTNCDFTCRTSETSGAITGGVFAGLLGVAFGLTLPTFKAPI